MNAIVREVSVILAAIVGLAIVAVLVSRNAQTPQVVDSFGRFFTGALNAATGPVSGGSFGTGFGYSTY